MNDWKVRLSYIEKIFKEKGALTIDDLWLPSDPDDCCMFIECDKEIAHELYDFCFKSGYKANYYHNPERGADAVFIDRANKDFSNCLWGVGMLYTASRHPSINFEDIKPFIK